MTNKGILKRKIVKARKAYHKAVKECTTGYSADILIADMKLKYALHQYHKIYPPQKLPTFSYIYKGDEKWMQEI